MTIQALTEVIDADRFRAFTLRLADGRAIRVTNPHSVAFLGNGRTLFVAHPRQEKFELIDLILINSVEVSTSSGSAGKRRRSA